MRLLWVLGEQNREWPEKEENFPGLEWITQHFTDVNKATEWITMQKSHWEPKGGKHGPVWKSAVYMDSKNLEEPSVSMLSWVSGQDEMGIGRENLTSG